MKKIGILLTNTGTPQAPTIREVRRYLRTFLSDKRVVHLPRLVWLPILYGLILPFRAKKSLQMYQKIWTDAGSPMQIQMRKLEMALQESFTEQSNNQYFVKIGMHYSFPSIKTALDDFNQSKVDTIVALPLYPQYSNTTTASSYDQISVAIKQWKHLPNLHFIRGYATHHDYISALAKTVKTFWERRGKSQCLLISFHGIPERFIKAGDVYQEQCEQTANLLAQKLELNHDDWKLCYQSQFGYDKWLKPSTQVMLSQLPTKNIKKLDIICPGFAVDCLETLEEISIRGNEIFKQAGGHQLRYIPALNDSEHQIELIHSLINKNY